jgi:HEAT repeats
MRVMRRRNAKQWYELLTRAYADYFESETISVNKWWKTRVAAERGLISCGAEAIPYAVELLANRDPEIREDGAAVLGALGEDERVVDALLRALEREDEDQPRDVIIIGLGRLRNTKAIPFLATTIRDSQTDSDTRFTAIQSLGQIARRRFDRQPEPDAAALDWLSVHGY